MIGAEQRVNVCDFTVLASRSCLQKHHFPLCSHTVSTVQDIEAAIPRLTRAEVEALRRWIDDYLEDQLELTEDVKTKLDQSRREIAAGQFTTRRPE